MNFSTTFQSAFLQTMEARGFIHQQTNAKDLDKLLVSAEQSNKIIVSYIGFDCTAPSLHIGSMLQIMSLRHFQKSGHKPIILLGGGTTKIGDPSGKDESRQLLDAATINANKQSIKENFTNLLEFEENFTPNNNKALLLDNASWIDNLNYPQFLREIGRHFSVNKMLTMDSVKLRLDREGAHLSFLEFNYMVLQAYDFVVLNKKYNCQLQMGGSDQWGNIVMGIDLHHHINAADNLQLSPIFGLTTPLITTSSGEKMGKTAKGAVWLNADMYSPYDYWQFWRNCEDEDVIRFLKLFTELPLSEIAELAKLSGAELNEAKKILATEATSLLHGEKAAKLALKTAEEVFEQKQASSKLPEFIINQSQLETGIAAYKLFVACGLEESGKKARNLIRGGGARINDKKITDEMQLITNNDLNDNKIIKLSAGKKKHMLIKIEP